MSESVLHKKITFPFFSTSCIGAVVVFLGLSLFNGSFSQAFGIIAISIICTAGAGLIFWIPVCYIVGLIVVSVAHTFSRPEQFFASEDTTEVNTSVLRPAVEYVANARKHGMGKDEIVLALVKNGWSAEQIKKVIS